MADKVTNEQLRAIINSEINNSIGFMGSNLTSQRKNLWNITWVKSLVLK